MYLNCHSQFSFNYGLLRIEELVSQAKNLGLVRIALTDINNTSGTIEFVRRCEELGICPVIGIEFRRQDQCLYIGLAKNRRGFSNLNVFLNRHLVDGESLPDEAPNLPDTLFIYPYLQAPARSLEENEYVGVLPHEVFRWHFQDRFPRRKSVCLVPVTIRDAGQWHTHRLLRCMALNTILSKLPPEACANQYEHFSSPQVLTQLYAAHPYLIRNANLLLESCSFELDPARQPNMATYHDNSAADFQLLRDLAIRGLRQRYGLRHLEYRNRLETELSVIQSLHFTHYFLITWDITRYARRSGFRHVGRGSGANSLVAYVLYITDVDPIALNLYFERFINPHRPVPPDFDLDFSWDERDQVIRYTRDHFGPERVGLLATYQTYKGKSVVREMGKILGLSRKEIDGIIRDPSASHKHHPLAKIIFTRGKDILELPSHLSMHPGGVVISAFPLTELTASQMMPKGFSVTHFDMHHAEQWGLHKYDILSQRGTGHIKETIAMVRSIRNEEVHIADMEMIIKDQKTLKLLQTPGACIGCFYIESPAMRGLLTKVPCRNYRDLVAVSSIIRPGVAKSGMMQRYIECFHDPSRIFHLHPAMAEILEETFGIMVYQEDVMKVVQALGKFDLFESDLLRRLMTGKNKSEADLTKLRTLFFENSLASGIPSRTVQELWRQIASFSGYSFCKAHSATYAAESMQSLFLKAHYPVEFMVAVINNAGGFYPREVYVRELIRLGALVELPCIKYSSWLTRIHQGKVYLGLNLIKGLSLQTGKAVLTYRKSGDMPDPLSALAKCVPPSQLDLLIEVGALRCLEPNPYKLIFGHKLVRSRSANQQLRMFQAPPFLFEPDLELDRKEEALRQMRLLGFTLPSPFDMFDPVPDLSFDRISRIRSCAGVRIIGYYLLEKPVTTEQGEHMCFVTWYDQQLAFFDTVHFARVLQQYPLQGKGIYLIEGTLEREYGYAQIIVTRCHPIQLLFEQTNRSDSLPDYQYLRSGND